VDLTGRTLNYAGYELIRDVNREALGFPDKCLFHGILPSSSMLRKVGAKVEMAADKILPVEFFETKMGEGFRFTNVAKNIKLLFKALGLHEKEKCVRVELSTVIDCAPVYKTDSLITFGLTFSDVSTKGPITNTTLGLLHSVEPRLQYLHWLLKE
jgi:hypothetical protein